MLPRLGPVRNPESTQTSTSSTNGFDVLAYDYRGIGASRPIKLHGFDASWIDWGYLDFDAVVRHVVMPMATMVFGYFPAKRLGWMEDTPKGVVREWAYSRARFGFFNSRFEHKLWSLLLEWLQFGRVPQGFPGVQSEFAPNVV